MFSHIMIGTNDLDKAKAFYDKLGESIYTLHSNTVSNVTLTPACGVGGETATCDRAFQEPSNPIEILGPATGSDGCARAVLPWQR